MKILAIAVNLSVIILKITYNTYGYFKSARNYKFSYSWFLALKLHLQLNCPKTLFREGTVFVYCEIHRSDVSAWVLREESSKVAYKADHIIRSVL